MRFLKILFWILVAVAIIVFSLANWAPVSVNLWGGIVLDTKLPVMLILAFLLGLLPTLILHRATRWSLTRKLDSAERAMEGLRASDSASAVPSQSQTSGTLPPSAAPIAVPSGVS